MLSLRSQGAAAYARVAVESRVPHADPHQLILLLYDGAIAAVQQALLHLADKRVSEKGTAVSKAIQIIDEGLRLSLDESQGGELALQLRDLYDYMSRRLLFASVRGEPEGMHEVLGLLRELRSAWAEIAPEKRIAAQAGGNEPPQPPRARPVYPDNVVPITAARR
jgi:flagellar secretion chaperone FliS